MNEKINIVIADDNVFICEQLKKIVEEYDNEFNLIGIANTDEDEIRLIEDLKPDVVITDLVRKHKYTGLEIIKKYSNKKNSPKFLVISADREEDIFFDGFKVSGYIKKPYYDKNIVIEILRKIKEEMYINTQQNCHEVENQKKDNFIMKLKIKLNELIKKY